MKQEELEIKIFKLLKEPFDLSAYSIDSSRGFDLSSLKAQYIPDRLNEVLGLTNWNFSGEFEIVMDGDKQKGILFHGILTLKIGERNKTIFSVGYSSSKKNEGDSRKGAMTDSLSKAASHVGIADESFKGKINCEDIKNNNQKKVKKGEIKKIGKTGKAPSFSKNKKEDELFT